MLSARIFNKIDLSKITKLILILCIISVISACGRERTERKNVIVLSPKQLIDSFYHYKKLYLLEDKKYFPTLQEKWNEIVLNRDSVLSYLLCSDFKRDSSTSLYGEDYPESKGRGVQIMMVPTGSKNPNLAYLPETSYNYEIEKIPNYIHALYLVEAIIHNNYLFNRRFNTTLYTDSKEFLYHDGLNFIHHRDSIPSINIYYNVFFSYDIETLYLIWKKYTVWFKAYQSTKQLGYSPLKTTVYRWYNRDIDAPGGSVSPNIIYSTDKYLIKIYRLDYKIGNGWAPAQIRK